MITRPGDGVTMSYNWAVTGGFELRNTFTLSSSAWNMPTNPGHPVLPGLVWETVIANKVSESSLSRNTGRIIISYKNVGSEK